MRTIAHIIAALLVTTMLVHAIAGPAHGIVYANPWATLGVALMGLGLTMRCHERQAAAVTVKRGAVSEKTIARDRSIAGD